MCQRVLSLMVIFICLIQPAISKDRISYYADIGLTGLKIDIKDYFKDYHETDGYDDWEASFVTIGLGMTLSLNKFVEIVPFIYVGSNLSYDIRESYFKTNDKNVKYQIYGGSIGVAGVKLQFCIGQRLLLYGAPIYARETYAYRMVDGNDKIQKNNGSFAFQGVGLAAGIGFQISYRVAIFAEAIRLKNQKNRTLKAQSDHQKISSQGLALKLQFDF